MIVALNPLKVERLVNLLQPSQQALLILVQSARHPHFIGFLQDVVSEIKERNSILEKLE